MQNLINLLQSHFTKAVEVKLHPTIYSICHNFSKQVNSTTCYDDCGQTDLNKRELDNLVGKLGEWGVYGCLLRLSKKIGFNLTKPDMQIYSSNNKSWISDFVISSSVNNNPIKIAVKSQDYYQAKRYGFSGTFQIDPNRKDNIFKNPNELVFLCMVNPAQSKVLVLPPKQFSAIKLADPKLAKYKNLKKCYYACDNFNQTDLDDWINKFEAEN